MVIKKLGFIGCWICIQVRHADSIRSDDKSAQKLENKVEKNAMVMHLNPKIHLQTLALCPKVCKKRNYYYILINQSEEVFSTVSADMCDLSAYNFTMSTSITLQSACDIDTTIPPESLPSSNGEN